MRVLLIKKDKINGNIYELSKKESNYLTNVLRLKNGDSFKAKDEKENIYNALLNGNYLSLSENNDDVLFLDAMPSFKGHFQRIHLYQSILKGKKNERVLRDSQEAGVEKLTFISTEFTSADEITEHEASRLEAIRREAVQQSGAKVMDIGAVMKFDDAIEEAEGIILILHQSPRVMTKSIKEALQDVKKEDVISVFIGSEGGFSDAECEKAEKRNAIPVLLKTNILRAENASIYTISAIQTLLNE